MESATDRDSPAISRSSVDLPEPERDVRTRLTRIMIDRLLDVAVSLVAWNDHLRSHCARRARSRNVSK